MIIIIFYNIVILILKNIISVKLKSNEAVVVTSMDLIKSVVDHLVQPTQVHFGDFDVNFDFKITSSPSRWSPTPSNIGH